MDNKIDVAIVSVFGRGNWLAAELADHGFKVSLIDVSEAIGRWTPEDWEGPFGLFRSELIAPSQVARLHEEDYEDSVDQGFTLWLKDGPVDFKGPISSYLLEKQGVSSDCVKYLSSYDSLSPSEVSKLKKKVDALGFQHNWLPNLAHQLAGTTYTCNSEGLSSGRPLPLFSPYFIRRVSRRGSQRSLEWLKEKGVVVYNQASLKDLSIEGSLCRGVEIVSDWSGAVSASQFVWMLTSAESKNFSAPCSALYPNQAVDPEWGWIRYRIQFKDSESLRSLPHKFVLIDELELPWTHSNLCLGQMSVNLESWDFWMKIPAQHRFRRSYLEELGQELVQKLKQRVVESDPEILDMPQEYHYDESELGPSRFPIYLEDELKKITRKSLKNLTYGGPEFWPLLDWTGQFSHQKILFQNLVNWKKQNEIEKSKGK